MVKFPSSEIKGPEMLEAEISKYFKLDSIDNSTGSVPEYDGLYPISKCCSSDNCPSWGGSGPSNRLPCKYRNLSLGKVP